MDFDGGTAFVYAADRKVTLTSQDAFRLLSLLSARTLSELFPSRHPGELAPVSGQKVGRIDGALPFRLFEKCIPAVSRWFAQRNPPTSIPAFLHV